jgi:hypothetical protein
VTFSLVWRPVLLVVALVVTVEGYFDAVVGPERKEHGNRGHSKLLAVDDDIGLRRVCFHADRDKTANGLGDVGECNWLGVEPLEPPKILPRLANQPDDFFVGLSFRPPLDFRELWSSPRMVDTGLRVTGTNGTKLGDK